MTPRLHERQQLRARSGSRLLRQRREDGLHVRPLRRSGERGRQRRPLGHVRAHALQLPDAQPYAQWTVTTVLPGGSTQHAAQSKRRLTH